MDAPLILHGMASPNVTKVVLMLEECGLDYRLANLDVLTGGQFTPEFRALNPFSKGPVLEDPRCAVPLFESGAILIYLAEREGRFLPAAQPARAETIQWLMAQMALAGPMFGQLNHFRFILPSGSEPYAEARYRAQAERIYRVFDDRLAAHEWLAGGEYSIADMAFHPWSYYLERHGFDPAGHPAVVRWREGIAGREAARRANERMAAAFTAPVKAAQQRATSADLDRFFGRADYVPPADFSAVLRM